MTFWDFMRHLFNHPWLLSIWAAMITGLVILFSNLVWICLADLRDIRDYRRRYKP